MVKKILYVTYGLVFLLLLGCIMLFIPGPLKENTLFTTYKGASALNIANELSKQGIIRNKYFFAYATRLLGLDKQIVIGEFEIKKHTSMAGVIKVLINNKKIYNRKIVIPEGYTVAQICDVLNKNPYLTGSIPKGIKEGTLMPNTYYFHKGESRCNLINRMLKEMSSYVSYLWKNRDPSLPYSSKEDAVILASIVEKETAVSNERPLIAGVFLNRLKLNMRLQSDPTVAYGLNKPNAKGLTKKDLQTPTPYNTYTKKGLPIAPIANPGKAALDAVFHPAVTDYLFFVADGSGAHNFSSNLQDHNKYVAKWRQVENSVK